MDTTADWSILSTRDFFFSSRRRHTRCLSDWSSDVCSSDLTGSSHATRGSLIMAVAEPVSPSAGPPGDGSAAAAKREIKIVLPGLLLAILLAMLDQLIVGTALPRIVGDLGGVAHLSWVVTAYVLTSTVSTPLYGKLGDSHGRKKLFLTAIVIFLIGSALSGLAQSMTQLIAFRALQGLGAGGLMVGAISILGELG